jgi:hypothetical protein
MLTRLYSGAIFALLIVVLLPGYARALILGSVINVQAWASILLLVLLSAHFAFREGKSVYLLAVAALFASAAVLGYFHGGDAKLIIEHAFIFSPFIIAFLLLELRIAAPIQTVMVALSIAAALGAMAANAIQVFSPDLLALLIKDEDDVTVVVNLGRVAWGGYIAALVIVGQLGFLDLYTKRARRVIKLCVPIVLVGALLTFNRTLTVALALLGIYLLMKNWRKIGLAELAAAGVLVLAAGLFITWWGGLNPALLDLIEYRILSFFTGSADVSVDLSIHLVLYAEYLARIKASFILGQGLGVPVSTLLGPATWSDITLITFVIPFGVFGVTVFAVFLRRLYLRISAIEDARVRGVLVIVFLLGLVISLNDDIWSHKYFVVYLAYVANSWGACRIGTPREKLANDPAAFTDPPESRGSGRVSSGDFVS